jgi:hypothetical protein
VNAGHERPVEHGALRPAEAAEYLSMSRASFYRYVVGEVPCVYVGRMRLYPVPGLDRWLERHATG